MAIYLNDKIDIVVNEKDKKVYAYDIPKRKTYYITWGIYLYLKILDSDIEGYLNNVAKENIDKLNLQVEKLYSMNILVHKGRRRLKDSIRYKLKNNPLNTIQIEVTSRCNFNCKHCYNNGNIESRQLSFEKIIEIIDDGAEMGVNTICITGGEPLVRKDLKEILSYINKKNLGCELFTNGFLLDSDYCNFLKDINVSKVRISLDGKDEETHDNFRNKPGSFNRVIDAVKNLKELNIPVEINSVVHRGNIKDVKGLCDFFEKELGVKHKLDFVAQIGNAEKNYSKIAVSVDEYCESIKPYVNDIIQCHDHCNNEQSCFCGVGRDFVYIKSDGLVKLCPSIEDKFNYGSIEDKRFKDLWTDEMENRYKNINCKYIDECQCSDICNGGCRNRGILFGNNLDDPDKVFCKLLKSNVFYDMKKI